MENTIELESNQANNNAKRNADDNHVEVDSRDSAPKKARIRNREANPQRWENNEKSKEETIVVIDDNYPENQKEAKAPQANSKAYRAHVAGNVGANQGEQRYNYRGQRNGGVGYGVDADSGRYSYGGGGYGGGGGGNAGGNGNGGGYGNHYLGGAKCHKNHMQRSDEFIVAQRLHNLNGPTLELDAPNDEVEFKFSGRNRLYVGNLCPDLQSEKALRVLFEPFGELGDIYFGPDKKFSFVKVDYHMNAVKAKRGLDGKTTGGRSLRVRFAPSATSMRVSNLSPFVSNELLYKAFEVFGPVERATITVDDRGNHMGEGTVEFAKKSSANICLRLCQEKCYFLTAALRPCIVEPKELIDETNGFPEKSMTRNSQYNKERSFGPRFAEPDSFDHDYGSRWKELHELYKAKSAALKRELKMEEEKLEEQLELIRYERETQLLRQELQKREADKARLKVQLDMRQNQALNMELYDEEGMPRRQHFHMQPEAPPRRRLLERPMYRPLPQPNGFIGGCDYSNSTMDMENSPFVVFADETAKGNLNETDAHNQVANFGNNFDNTNPNMIEINENIGENNALWGRRSI